MRTIEEVLEFLTDRQTELNTEFVNVHAEDNVTAMFTKLCRINAKTDLIDELTKFIRGDA